MPMTRRVVLVGAAGLGLAAAPSRPPPKAPSNPPLLLGALFPLSGEAALIGDEGFRGLALAVDALNAGSGLLGRRVALKRADAPDPTIAANAAKDLIAKQKVAAIFGTGVTAMSLTASAAAAVASVPYFELTATGAPITTRGLPDVFRSCPEASEFGAASVAALIDIVARGWRRAPKSLRFALLASSSTLGQTVSEAQAKECKSRGLTPAQVFTYPAGTVDFMTLIQALKGAGIDVVLHTGVGNDIVLFYRGMAAAHWRPGMVIGSGPSYALADTSAAVGTALDGTLVAAFPPYAINPHAAPGASGVATAYQQRYGADPRSGLSLAAYVGAEFFFAALTKAGGTDLVKLRASVLAYNVAIGTTANGWGADFDASGQNLRAHPVLAQWRKGRCVTVAPVEFATAVAEPWLCPPSPPSDPADHSAP
ncbi:MAG: ABC transporter substrate-binding protein [Acetobacteraceae bacterium]